MRFVAYSCAACIDIIVVGQLRVVDMFSRVIKARTLFYSEGLRTASAPHLGRKDLTFCDLIKNLSVGGIISHAEAFIKLYEVETIC